MCGNPFKSPKTQTITVEKPVVQEVEKVRDPEPTPVTQTDAGSAQDRADQQAQKDRKKKGYQATRVADRGVLTDTAQSGMKNTLG